METIHAAVGIIIDKENRVLVDCRPNHWEMSGFWEFPGGKLEPKETVQQALTRELKEEIGITVLTAEPLIQVKLTLPKRHLILDAWQVLQYNGQAQSLEGQELRWVNAQELQALKMLESNQQILDVLCQKLKF